MNQSVPIIVPLGLCLARSTRSCCPAVARVARLARLAASGGSGADDFNSSPRAAAMGSSVSRASRSFWVEMGLRLKLGGGGLEIARRGSAALKFKHNGKRTVQL